MKNYFIVSERMICCDRLFRRTYATLHDLIREVVTYKHELILHDGTTLRFVNFEQWNTLKRGMRDYDTLGDLYFENWLDKYEKGMKKDVRI